jgi:hypothetical protein
MTADSKTERCPGSIRTDQIGKVFIVVGQDVRKCLVCEEFFTRRAASEHATVLCMPGTNTDTAAVLENLPKIAPVEIPY